MDGKELRLGMKYAPRKLLMWCRVAVYLQGEGESVCTLREEKRKESKI